MTPPSWICRALHRVHPHLRLAWQGRGRAYSEELNPGSFALIQLYHISDVQGFDDPATFRLPWVADPVEGGDGRIRTKRVNRGPIFNKVGGAKADWDSAFRVPIFVATLDESYGLSLEDVLSGKFLTDVKRWMTPIQRRVRESAVQKGKDLKLMADDVSGEMADNIWFKAKKHDSASTTMAYKHAKQDMQGLDKKLELADNRLRDYYLPPEV